MIFWRNRRIYIRLFLIFFCSFLTAFPVKANICKNIEKPKPNLKIVFEPEKLKYDLSKTTMEMIIDESGSRDQWLIEHGIDPQKVHSDTPLITNGLYTSSFSWSRKLSSYAVPADKYNVYFCPYIENLEIVFSHKARIIMPKEIKKGTCEHKHKILHHEKYYLAALKVGSETINKLNKDISIILGQIYSSAEHVDGSQLNKSYEMLDTTIKDVIEIYYQDMKNSFKLAKNSNESDEEFSRLDKAIKACEKERS